MDADGQITNINEFPTDLSLDTIVKIYEQMLLCDEMDTILYDIQRQLRISFYLMSHGENACSWGSCVALNLNDIIYAQYREPGIFMWRGFTLDDFCNQCYSNVSDQGKGRQMPVHYGSRALNIKTISSPLATQIPQAAGAAYAMKRSGSNNVVVCYFGEGAASEGDFACGLNIAACLEVPVIFFCRNNQYAISTSVHEQYRGDGIAARGIAYGIYTVRVDGNDMFAVYVATKQARAYAVKNQKPVLIEAITYRVSNHSTSDDSSKYRNQEEIEEWKKKSPVLRLRKYLERKCVWNETMEKEKKEESRKSVIAAVKRAERQLKPKISEMFTDVYDKVPEILKEQKKELEAHLKLYKDVYPIDKHAQEKK